MVLTWPCLFDHAMLMAKFGHRYLALPKPWRGLDRLGNVFQTTKDAYRTSITWIFGLQTFVCPRHKIFVGWRVILHKSDDDAIHRLNIIRRATLVWTVIGERHARREHIPRPMAGKRLHRLRKTYGPFGTLHVWIVAHCGSVARSRQVTLLQPL